MIHSQDSTHHLMTDAFHTHTDTYSWPYLPKELFRAGYFFHEQAQALMCGNTRCHTENICTTEPEACA